MRFLTVTYCSRSHCTEFMRVPLTLFASILSRAVDKQVCTGNFSLHLLYDYNSYTRPQESLAYPALVMQGETIK